MDVGQPKDFLTGTGLYLSSLHKTSPKSLCTKAYVVGNVLCDPTAIIGDNVRYIC